MSEFDQHQLDNDFRQACSLGNLSEVTRFVTDKVVDINVADKFCTFTGLHMACEHDQFDVVNFLLKHKASVNVQNSLGETPLITALKINKKSKSKPDVERKNKMVATLIEHGGDLGLGYSKDVDSKAKPRSIHCAMILGDVAICRMMLVAMPALVSTVDDVGRFPIHYAAKYGQIFVMQELLVCGSELEPVDNEGFTPFHVACDRANLDIVQFILDQGGHMHTKTKIGDQALHIACRHKVKEIIPIVEFLINQGADRQATDSQNKCLKDHIRDNILLKNVIASAKKSASKYANIQQFSQYGAGGRTALNASSSGGNLFGGPLCNNSFGILDLKGQRLYSSSGYKMDNSSPKVKKIDGSVALYEHGLLFSFKKGFISKSSVEEFHPWKPYVELIADDAVDKLLRVEFPGQENEENDEKQQQSSVSMAQKFGIHPCRATEIMETIQKEVDKMYPTYTLQNEIKRFVNEIGDEQGVQNMVKEFHELRQNLSMCSSERDEIKAQLEQNDSTDLHFELQARYDQLHNEVVTVQSRLNEMQQRATVMWNECEGILQQKVEPLIEELCLDIDSMISRNEHWKIISNVRNSLTSAKNYRKKLINVRTQIRDIDQNQKVAVQNAAYPTV